ncbi:Protein-tyrosine phosphatase [Giardia duodenalis]|uniref:protein-tyrosine-phosphatase n=1 Tax=Giardia intestinalis TaxID=5741 RepID=V6TAE4_GIAIN|nr:Protein-tyrosine phosphatase [Giardia intestinalis]
MPVQGRMVEFIPDRLYYATITGSSSDTADTHYFTTDSTLVYYPFEQDFGPLNLGQTYVFFAQLSNKLKDPNLKAKKIVYYSSSNFSHRANSVTLIGLFMVCVLQKSAKDIADLISKNVQPALVPFRDACMGPCSYGMTVADCLFAMEKAMSKGLFNLNTFKYDDYYFYSQVENGDLTWMLLDKFVAFAGPVSQSHPFFRYHPFTPASYIPLFQSRNITAVIRLNEACYNRTDFIKAGIHHYDLPFPDGSCPPDKIIKQFIEITDKETGGVAVHCKAGLGRTGSLIALYMMQRYDFTGREIIAWLRILRPGSILGQQQQFLISMESKIKAYYRQKAAAVQEGSAADQHDQAVTIPISASPSRGTAAHPGLGSSNMTGALANTTSPDRHAATSRSGASGSNPMHFPSRSSPTRGVVNSSPSRQPDIARTSGTDRVRQKLADYLKNSPTRTANTRSSNYDGATSKSSYQGALTTGRVGSSVRAMTPGTGAPGSPMNLGGGMYPSSVNRPGIASGRGGRQGASGTYGSVTRVPRTGNMPRTPGVGERKEEMVSYGFGANGRVHPDVVQTPKSQLGRHTPSRSTTSSVNVKGGRTNELPTLKPGRQAVRPVTEMY